jgi:flagellar motility protein MotE (MotC chaperone)
MPSFSFTQLRHRSLVDCQGVAVGRLEDLAVLALGAKPQVTKLCLRRPDGEEWILPWESVADLPRDPDAPIRLRSGLADLSPVTLRPEEMRLGKNVLDKKVVDTARKKVVRVNDIELEEREGRLHVTGVEGGLRGLLRNLKSEWLGERLAALAGAELPREVVAWEALEPLETELTRAKRHAVYTKLAKLHPADIADIMEELNPSERATILAALDEATAAETITEAEPEVQASMVQMMEPEKAADILEEMEPDKAADVLAGLSPEVSQDVFDELRGEDAREMAALLRFEGNSAGGMMTTEFVLVGESASRADVVEWIRKQGGEAGHVDNVFLIDGDAKLSGAVEIARLLLAPEQQAVSEIKSEPLVWVPADANEREVFELFDKYNLRSLAVVDGSGRPIGSITVDDVVTRLRAQL